MTWARLDDAFPEHIKILKLSDKAFRVHIAAICYAARNLTDGHLPAEIIPSLAVGRKAAVGELVTARVWDRNGDGGYAIHDYLDYNPSREHVEAERERRAAAGKKGAKKRWQQP